MSEDQEKLMADILQIASPELKAKIKREKLKARQAEKRRETVINVCVYLLFLLGILISVAGVLGFIYLLTKFVRWSWFN